MLPMCDVNLSPFFVFPQNLESEELYGARFSGAAKKSFGREKHHFTAERAHAIAAAVVPIVFRHSSKSLTTLDLEP